MSHSSFITLCISHIIHSLQCYVDSTGQFWRPRMALRSGWAWHLQQGIRGFEHLRFPKTNRPTQTVLWIFANTVVVIQGILCCSNINRILGCKDDKTGALQRVFDGLECSGSTAGHCLPCPCGRWRSDPEHMKWPNDSNDRPTCRQRVSCPMLGSEVAPSAPTTPVTLIPESTGWGIALFIMNCSCDIKNIQHPCGVFNWSLDQFDETCHFDARCTFGTGFAQGMTNAVAVGWWARFQIYSEIVSAFAFNFEAKNMRNGFRSK